MDSVVLHHCLRRLIRHVESRGSLSGAASPSASTSTARVTAARSATAEDIDFVAAEVDAVCHTVTNDFLVSHFHLPQASYPKFLIQLVDPVTRLRLDFFPDTTRSMSRAPVLDVAGIPLRVLDARDILDHKMSLLSNASAAHPGEQKHYADAERLGAMCGRHVAPTRSCASPPLSIRKTSMAHVSDVTGAGTAPFLWHRSEQSVMSSDMSERNTD